MGSRVAFIGLGTMGSRMVTRILAAGHEVVVSDVSADAMAAMEAKGATIAPDARAAASQAEIVLVSLPTPAIIEAVALGDKGIVEGTAVKIYVDLSTTGSVVAKRVAAGLAEKGIVAVDAPVSGGPSGVEAGTLAIMSSGDKEAFETVKPILESFAGKIFYLGSEVGLGQVAKLANNLLGATSALAAGEVLAFAMRSGLDPSVLLEVINASTGRSFATEVSLPPAVKSGVFDVGFRTELMYKDVKLAVNEAEAVGSPMWIGNNIAQFFTFAMTQGLGKSDITALTKVFSDWSGVEYPFVPKTDS
jgi:3-hydroxyisobutyrate dehydrogenase-like beta-hydroxyacid dehydrogenase